MLSNQPARTITKQMQTHSKRQKPRRGTAGTFDPKTRKAIIERDRRQCVRCEAPYQEIHHIIFRSQLGKGTIDNGVCVCTPCHILAHKHDSVRRWFEAYKQQLI
jgi:5-methylcytosine-specific restriction endonuclease McrA